MRACVRLQIFVLLTGGPIPLYASGAPDDGEVIVRGTIPHCKPLSDDPQDALVPPLSKELITIVPDAPNGGFRFVPNLRDGRPQVKASPDLWLRSGAKLANFTFRVPKDGTPLCIGLKPGHSSGQAKIMKIMDAMPFACRFVRFSLFVAARKADGVIWLNGGFHGNKNAGAYNTYAAVSIPSRMSWTPVLLQVGPIDKEAGWLHLGVHLTRGDVWFVQPRFDVIPDSELSAARRKDAEICRSNRHTPFWQQRDNEKL